MRLDRDPLPKDIRRGHPRPQTPPYPRPTCEWSPKSQRHAPTPSSCTRSFGLVIIGGGTLGQTTSSNCERTWSLSPSLASSVNQRRGSFAGRVGRVGDGLRDGGGVEAATCLVSSPSSMARREDLMGVMKTASVSFFPRVPCLLSITPDTFFYDEPSALHWRAGTADSLQRR